MSSYTRIFISTMSHIRIQKFSSLYPVSIVTGGYFLPHNHDNNRMLCRFCFIYNCITTGSLKCKVPRMHTRQHILITTRTNHVGEYNT